MSGVDPRGLKLHCSSGREESHVQKTLRRPALRKALPACKTGRASIVTKISPAFRPVRCYRGGTLPLYYYYVCHPTVCSISCNIENQIQKTKRKPKREAYARSLTPPCTYVRHRSIPFDPLDALFVVRTVLCFPSFVSIRSLFPT